LDEWSESAVELEPRLAESLLECGDELAAEDTAEHFDGKKKGVLGGDPASLVGGESTSSDYAVNMRMMLQSLIPGMEDAEEADPGAPVTGIAGDLQQGFSAGWKQQVVDQSLVLQCERSEFTRECENDVDIVGGQPFPFPCLEPAQAGVALASWAMPVATRVIRDGCRSAVRALIAVSPQRGGAAACDGEQHLFVLSVDPLATALNERLSCTANDVGHLQRRPVHALCVCSPSPRIVSASSGLPVALR
jgi:hypothetical protein